MDFYSDYTVSEYRFQRSAHSTMHQSRSSATGQALNYMHIEWDHLIRYLDDVRLESYAYLRMVFTELPKADTVDAIEALLPGNMDQIGAG